MLSTRYHDVMPDGESERARVRADESEGKQACSECGCELMRLRVTLEANVGAIFRGGKTRL